MLHKVDTYKKWIKFALILLFFCLIFFFITRRYLQTYQNIVFIGLKPIPLSSVAD